MRYRDPALAPYLRGGFAIEKRARRLRRFWEPHLERSKAAQRRWVEGVHGIDLAVLGAGRLFDFAREEMEGRFRRFLLIDADPSCAAHWSGMRVEVEPRIADLTGCADRWRREMEAYRGGWPETLDYVRQIVKPTDAPVAFAADAVLSLNLLSQLPIGWQDRVEDNLVRRFGSRHTKSREREWLDAVEPGAKWIVEQHLAALNASSARSILLITDVEYSDSHGNGTTEISPALYGVDPAAALGRYRLRWQESWQWDISPAGTESPTCGTAHRVAAFAFDRA
jgi:hypothetical protein